MAGSGSYLPLLLIISALWISIKGGFWFAKNILWVFISTLTRFLTFYFITQLKWIWRIELSELKLSFYDTQLAILTSKQMTSLITFLNIFKDNPPDSKCLAYGYLITMILGRFREFIMILTEVEKSRKHISKSQISTWCGLESSVFIQPQLSCKN